MSRPPYPFVALVGQERMTLGLILAAVAPVLSGVLIRGEKGTAKSTAVRALAELLPEREVVDGCRYRLTVAERGLLCTTGCDDLSCRRADPVPARHRRTPVVELPMAATEDRVAGALDLERALTAGVRRFEPGLLAAAHGGILYVDEVNLLDDHLVDLLLDSAAMGVNTVEREGVSLTHPARFSLVGTMNPEEGELRPQLLDRFGLCVTVEGCTDPRQRVEIMQRRLAYERDPDAFVARWSGQTSALRARIATATALLPRVTTPGELLLEIATTCLDAGVDGHRGDLTLLRAAIALAAWCGRTEVEPGDVAEAAPLVLTHRIRRQPFQDIPQHVAVR
ncbi:MAG: magnesium chelatase subunit [Actinomycetota bacterium]|nr:magnesium chelatase subunit [Actinomycetota bacterium]